MHFHQVVPWLPIAQQPVKRREKARKMFFGDDTAGPESVEPRPSAPWSDDEEERERTDILA